MKFLIILVVVNLMSALDIKSGLKSVATKSKSIVSLVKKMSKNT